MTTSSKLLDFFALEAQEYLSRIEAALAPENPDVPALQSGARGLRGSATMARSTPIANIAGRVESIAAKVSEGKLELNPQLRRVVASALETLTALVRSVRAWGPEHNERARRALDELDSFAPGEPERREDFIVPISELFYSDAGPHIVQVAATARTTFEQRLREKQTRPPQPPPPPPVTYPAAKPVAPQQPASTGLRGAALRDALGSSIAQMRAIERPGEPEAQQPVPIQSLLYRGEAAVNRAKELRAQIFSARTAPSRETVAELCDLVELANAE